MILDNTVEEHNDRLTLEKVYNTLPLPAPRETGISSINLLRFAWQKTKVMMNLRSDQQRRSSEKSSQTQSGLYKFLVN